MTLKLSQDVVQAFELNDCEYSAITSGHINTTLLVKRGDDKYILQKLSPIFGAEVHQDIDAVTRLVGSAVPMPRLIPTRDGQLWVTTGDGEVWRLLEWMPGNTHLRAQHPGMCESAGRLVGRFHRALYQKEHSFAHRRLGVHNTAAHLRTLEQSLQEHADHGAIQEVSAMARPVLKALAEIPDLTRYPERIVHGDLKISNILFNDTFEATTLIDLDTLAPMPLAHEMGDALRSWCNPQGEASTEASFSLPYFESAMRGYCESVQGLFESDEIMSIVTGVETIALELTVRFLADALNESYFGWDKEKYQSASEHNLERAQGQWIFAQSVGVQRKQAREILESILAQSA
ncbi:MAG: aminoglycoside phosphotransferase family protein [Deltaproteobacteria bacterium]|nr:aminoglycoside phosphotransferase family protein [Deltaproteobacteria bacterium]